LHRWRRSNAGSGQAKGRPQALFFAFSQFDKLTAIPRKPSAGVPENMEDMEGWRELSWGRFCAETHRAIVDIARQCPDIDVVIKCKGLGRNHEDVLRILDEIEQPRPRNLSVVTGGDPFDLIVRSQVIIGFNTTGLLEAVATGRTVIVPHFAEAAEESMQDLIINLTGAVEYAGSPDELKTMTADFARSPRDIPAELSGEAKRVLRYWTRNDDGRAGLRVVDAVRREIEFPVRSCGESASCAVASA
jgi:hypothetical protein